MRAVTTELSDDEMRAWQALLHAHEKVTRELDQELRGEHHISMADYDVLLRLARTPGRALRMSDLAERVMLSPSGLTRAVDRLEHAGLIRRERVPDDARVTVARLTDVGRRRLRAAARTHLRGVREHFTGQLSASQLRSVAVTLEVVSGPHTRH
jgi:DNA-binding MarR family transcriptional regulator